MRFRRRVARLLERTHHYLIKVPQRMEALVVLGIALILGSHFLSDKAEREWARDGGAGVIAFGVTRWLSQQGQRRRDEQNKQIRKATMRFWIDEEEK